MVGMSNQILLLISLALYLHYVCSIGCLNITYKERKSLFDLMHKISENVVKTAKKMDDNANTSDLIRNIDESPNKIHDFSMAANIPGST
jgi:hypothetical protein